MSKSTTMAITVGALLALAAAGCQASSDAEDPSGGGGAGAGGGGGGLGGGGAPAAACTSRRPMGEGVIELHPAVDCPEGLDCRVIDLAVDVRPELDRIQALKARFVMPRAASGPVPVMLTFPGTGTCGVDTPIDQIALDADSGTRVRYQLASEGVLTVQLAIRGHHNCYGPNALVYPDDPNDPEIDSLYGQASWIGPEEFADYDELLRRLLAANLHPELPQIDPQRVGLSGGSHGGVTSLIYATQGQCPAEGLALVAPSVGSPRLLDWLGGALDPDETLETARFAGMPRVAGLRAQLQAYPDSSLSALMAVISALQEPLPAPTSALADFAAARTAYDPDGGLDRFDRRVHALVMQTGGRDCIVPDNGQVELWERLQQDYDRPADRWYFSAMPHSCKAVTDKFPTAQQEASAGGYLPTWTAGLRDSLGQQMNNALLLAAREHLLGTPSELPGPSLITPLVRGDETGDRAPWRQGTTLSALVDGEMKLYLAESGLSEQPPAPFVQPVIDHQPAGVCEVMDIVNPCGRTWGPDLASDLAALEAVRSSRSYQLVLPQDTTLVGSARLSLRVHVPDDPGVGSAALVAMLRYIPPEDPTGRGWLITQAVQFFYRLDPSRHKSLVLELEPRVIELHQGGKLQLVLSNLSTYVHEIPWYHPLVTPYRIELDVDASHPAVLELPTSSTLSTMPLADVSPLGG